MSEAIWYFADGDVERGPVTEAQLRALIGTDNLKPDDLVWKEGMEDWMPAGEIPGLFVSDADSEPPKSDDHTRDDSNRDEAVRPAPAPVRAAARAVVERGRPALAALEFSEPFPVFKFAAFLGQPLLLVGLLLVLLARGCDSLGDRYVTRVAAKAEVAEGQFQDEWDDQRQSIERRLKTIADKEEPTDEDQETVTELNDELEALDKEMQSEMETLRTGRWRELASAARDAQANNEMWSFWRECIFWLGAFAFSMGSLIVGFTGQSAERWLCLAMLAIVVFSLFVGRLSW